MDIAVMADHCGDFASALEAAKARALEACGLYAEGDAKARCPVDTGRLRASITHRSDGERAVIGTNVEYARHVELGTGSQKAQPYLVPALERNAGTYRKLVGTCLRGA